MLSHQEFLEPSVSAFPVLHHKAWLFIWVLEMEPMSCFTDCYLSSLLYILKYYVYVCVCLHEFICTMYMQVPLEVGESQTLEKWSYKQ